MPYTDHTIINDKIKNILYQKHWQKINVNILETLDGDNQEEIIKRLFNFLYTSDNINKLLYWKILFKLEFMIKKIHVVDFIKSINIFFDGIPSYSKILEQRKRRMKNYLDSQNRKNIFKNYFKDIIETTVVEDDLTYDYFSWINNQFSFNKSLGPFSKILINLSNFLKSNLKIIFPENKIHISNSKVYGEADYKIFDYIKKQKLEHEICIHSCDSDFIHLILLSQLLSDIHNIDTNYIFIRYYTKNNLELYEITNAKKTNILLLEKYKIVNNVVKDDINITTNIILDLNYDSFIFLNSFFQLLRIFSISSPALYDWLSVGNSLFSTSFLYCFKAETVFSY